MSSLARKVLVLLRGLVFASSVVLVAPGAALAQFPPGLPNPDLANRIPAPLLPPPQPPIINGPLSQSPPPGVYEPKRLNTHSDRTTACLQQGAGQGLRGRTLDAYTRSNANYGSP